jgi:hypothetical protein
MIQKDPKQKIIIKRMRIKIEIKNNLVFNRMVKLKRKIKLTKRPKSTKKNKKE